MKPTARLLSVARLSFPFAAAIAALLAAPSAQAIDWNQTAAGTYTWGTGANWVGGTAPNGIGAVANLAINIAGNQTINLAAGNTTVGILNFGDSTSTFGSMTIASNTLVFDNSGAGAQLNHLSATTTADTISSAITLNDDLTITNSSPNSRNAPLTLSGKISGAGTNAITIASGTGFVFLSNTANDFSGGVILNAGSNFMTSNNARAFGTGMITINGGSVTSAVPSGASQNLTTANDMTWNGNWTYIQDTNNTAVWTMNGGITLGNNINVTRNQNMTINGIIDDGASTYSLTFSGGTTNTTLTNANTYKGGTTIGAGSLTISGSGSLGSGNYAGAISNAGTFNYSSSADQIFSGAITGTGALTKNTNNSTLTLSNGSNSYTGATTLSAGTLLVTSTGTLANTAIGVTNVGTTFKVTPAAGTVNLGNTATSAAGASLNLGSGTTFTMVDGTAGGTTTVRGGATGPTGLTLASANLNFELGGATADKLAVTRPASLTGVNYLNLTSVAALTSGTYNLITASSGLNTGGRFVLGSGGIKEVTSFGGVSYVLSLNNAAATQSVTVDTGVYWTGQTSGNGAADSSWNTTGSDNWADASTGANAITYANGNNVVFQDANAVAGGNVTNATVTIQAAGVTPGATIFNNSAVNYTLSNASGTIGLAGTGGLTKQGSGSVTLNSANTFTGGVGISAGNLILGNTGALNSTAGSENAVTFGTGSTGTLSLAGNSVIIANLITNSATPGTAFVQNATGSGVANASLTVGNSTNSVGTFAGILRDGTGGGTLSLIKAGTGTLTLSGNNSFSGGLTVNAGTLLMSGTQSYTGGITLTGGGFGENSANGAPVIQASTLNGNAITVNGSSHLVVEGTLTSTIAINSGIFKLGASGSSLIVQGVVSGTGVLDVNANNFNSNYSVSLTNTANTFSGDVTYSASNGANTLFVNSIGDAGKITVGSAVNALNKTFALHSTASAPLTFNTRQFELTGPSGAHNLAIANYSAQAFNINTNLLINATAAGTRTLTLNGTGTGLSTFAGNITKGTLTTLGITKSESGTWLLSGANDYNGVTTVSGGTLAFSGNANVASANPLGQSSAAAANLLLANGTTLKYVGGAASTDRGFTINGTVNNAGASLDASGTGAINFTSTASPAYGTTNQPRTLTLTGTNTGNNTLAANLTDNGASTNAVSIAKTGIGTWVLSGTNSATGTTNLSGGGSLILDYGTNNNTKLGTGILNLISGGSVILRAGSAFTQPVASLALGTGTNGGNTSFSRDTSGTNKIAFGAIHRNQSYYATLFLAEDNLATTTSVVVNGILSGGITVGSNWAKVSGGNIVGLVPGDYAGLPVVGTSTTNTLNYQLTGSALRNGAGSNSMNSLRITGSGTDDVLNAGANAINIGQLTDTGSVVGRITGNSAGGGILYTGGGNNNYTITGTTASSLAAQNGNQELIINTFQGTLNVDVKLTMGSQGLTKTGVGTLRLNGAGTYTGPTFVNQGVLRLSNSAGAGTTGAITVQNGAALELAIASTSNAKALTITGAGVSNGGALRNVASNTASYAGAITIGNGGARINSDSSGALTLTGGVTTSLFNNVTFGGAGNTTVSTAAIIGAGGLVKDGAGTTTLTATNTYTGATTVSEGTMNVSAGNINTTSSLNVSAGAKLAYNSSTALTVAPTLNGAGLANRAVLGGTGAINASVTLDNVGDTLSPGNSPGIEPFSVGQSWAAFSYDWEVNDFSDVTGLTAGSDFDQIGITGGLTLTGAAANSYYLNVLSLTAGNVTGLAENFSEINRSWNILTTTTGITGFDASYWNIDPTGFTNVEGGTWSLAQSGNNLVLSYTAVPEPRAALLGGLGMLLLLRRRRS